MRWVGEPTLQPKEKATALDGEQTRAGDGIFWISYIPEVYLEDVEASALAYDEALECNDFTVKNGVEAATYILHGTLLMA